MNFLKQLATGKCWYEYGIDEIQTTLGRIMSPQSFRQ